MDLHAQALSKLERHYAQDPGGVSATLDQELIERRPVVEPFSPTAPHRSRFPASLRQQVEAAFGHATGAGS